MWDVWALLGESLMNATEQIGKRLYVNPGRGVRRLLKRQTAKVMRRLSKLGDDAPKRTPYRGWFD